jgi:hypothetical protein
MVGAKNRILPRGKTWQMLLIGPVRGTSAKEVEARLQAMSNQVPTERTDEESASPQR